MFINTRLAYMYDIASNVDHEHFMLKNLYIFVALATKQ